MAEAEEPKKLESESPLDPPPAPTAAPAEKEKPLVEAPKDPVSHKEKSEIPPPPPPESKAEPDESKALAIVVDKPSEPIAEEKSKEGSVNRDAVLAKVATEKSLSLIRAWEESEKSKAENKAQKKLSAIGSWENTRKAIVEAELKKFEEKLEKQKAEYVEQMKNKIALIHKAAEEKRAVVEAKRGEDLLKAEETAAKCRATGKTPKKLLGWFSS
ncbi:remorin-like [Pyrus ussuriensis x Pyrus communis]|uniref:Remorin-like n=1 Tax=Pyrus ussuriensis x Pyrus communis TaxID=2448454 RepID=A0A5N5F128_9ROSA|nr:remorin-like [Pyrus ussuriensis x Pyrus communis]